MKKIGILGGTFDPIHKGHLRLAKQAMTECHLDEIWFMPSKQPPHKRNRYVTEAKDRCNMTKLAISGIPGFVYSDFEQNRKGYTYSSDTLTKLHEEFPETIFYFIIGADSLYEIETWHEPETVMRLAVIVAAGRTYKKGRRSFEDEITYLKERYGAEIMALHCEKMDVSSSEIRALISEGKSAEKFLSPAVVDYIVKHNLYSKKGN